MATDPVELRPARPDLDDGLRFAHYLNIAADGAFRALLGRRFERIIGQAFLSPGHDMSYETTVFAEYRGDIAGMSSAYSWKQHQESSDEPLKNAAGIRALRFATLSFLARGVLDFLETVPEGDFYLQAVAVDEDTRGAGIGSILLDDTDERARAAGCSRLALDVSEKNEGARQLYERRGMTIEAESPKIFLIPGTRAYRMTKEL